MENTYQPGNAPEFPYQAVPPMPPVHPFPVPQAPNGHAEPKPRLSRSQVREMRLMENSGVPFWLKRTGMEATVKALSFADRMMLTNIPKALQDQITESLNESQTRAATKTRSFTDLVQGAANDERLANAICIAGFVSPRLVATEAELDGSDDCWVVTDLHPDERKQYMALVLGNGNEEDMGRIARFLREGVAGAPAR